MPVDLSQPVRAIFDGLITQLEAFLASEPVPVPGTTVISGGVNSLVITSLEDLPALTATGGVGSLTVSLDGSTPAGTVITGGTNSITVSSLEPLSALTATGGVNSLTVAGA